MHHLLSGNRGYTLIDSLFQLIIFIIFAHLIVLFFLWKAPIDRQYGNLSTSEWELFAANLQKELAHVSQFNINTDQKGFMIETPRGRINFDQGNGVIRKRVDGQGHVPFLTKVSTATFTQSSTALFVEVTLLDGTRKERDFAIGLYQE